MKLTTSEFMLLFGFNHRDQVSALCRSGELDAVKNDKGMWIINVEVPKEIFDASKEVSELVAHRDGLTLAYNRKYREIQKEIEKRNSIILKFRKERGFL